MLSRRGIATLLGGLLLTGCAGGGAPGAAPERTAPPGLRVEVVADGLDHPWDVGLLPDGAALVPERSGRLVLLDDTGPGAQPRPVQADLDDVFAQGEGGLMGLVVHPDFAENRQFITCQTHQEGGRPVDVRLVRWELGPDGTSAERLDPLLTGLPVNPGGRHSGCRPAIAQDGSLLVSTGDAATPEVAQDRRSLGGKVLRMDLDTGRPLPDNPFAGAPDPRERLVLTYGHRNAQGVAPRPGGDQVLLAEHGPDVDDEINRLHPGGNYGWDPSRGGTSDGYDESVPMTDLQRFPDAQRAVWSSGAETEALSGAEFLHGPDWGPLDGTLAVTALKGSKLLLFGLGPDGAVEEISVPAELDGTHGRLRGIRQGPDGAAYLTTSNGADDRVLRVSLAG
ncbi:PQQ-dependent sugar dehydrogenase [Saccharopolyspora sp. HNM0983]|uniref:PQQ-dependent sugar dehydrogenase n=1 Tax=Saccharopolyspora montiporae TaxID=2781240 RepID=A0A929FZM4_9PSEU|nr:PQQ-dependent sugar dehydrogenase [Saccharopolyspora sp. HNM0983]MBE9373897.1 PQQ-dependent sugar dehydrogenase [Saccharopolyspora sp. HNM0983]